MRVLMVLENEAYPQDVRVRAEADALVRDGHELTVLAPRAPGQPGSETLAGVRVRRYGLPESDGSPRGFLLEYAVAHWRLLTRGLGELLRGVDVVHLHNPPDTLFPLGLAARALRRRVVFDQHDLFPELMAAKFGPGLHVRLATAAQRRALVAASAVIVTNESQRAIVLERGRLDPSAVTVVRNGPPSDTVVTRPTVRPGSLPEPRLVYVGTLGRQDGIQELPALLAHPSLTGARLTIVGDGPCRASLEARVARSRDLSRRVRVLGRVDHGRVPELLADADIGVDPAACSPFNDRSTMVKIAEYLAAGLPVVAYDLHETRITAGDAALYAPCHDRAAFARAVARLARDPALRQELADRGRRRAEQLVWERSERVLLATYRRLGEGD
jgi:glycosyltransferase involved in cell wall biosynthesis